MLLVSQRAAQLPVNGDPSIPWPWYVPWPNTVTEYGPPVTKACYDHAVWPYRQDRPTLVAVVDFEQAKYMILEIGCLESASFPF